MTCAQGGAHCFCTHPRGWCRDRERAANRTAISTTTAAFTVRTTISTSEDAMRRD